MAWAKTALAVAFLLILWALCPDVWANGGTLQLAKAQAGPYMVSVWTQPEPPRVGRLHMSVAIMRPPAEKPVLDATVRLTAQARDQAETRLVTLAQRGQGSNKLLYDTTLELPTAGRWHFTIQVNGPLGEGNAAFMLTAVASSSRLGPLFALAGGATSLVLVWLLWHQRR